MHGIHSQLRLRKKQWAQVLWKLLTRKRLPRNSITSLIFAFLNTPISNRTGESPLSFRMRHESIGSFYSPQFYGLFQSGKNCFYRMYNRSSTDWRKLLLRMSVCFMSILKEEGSGTWPLTHSLNALLNFWRIILGMRWSDVRLVVKKKRTSVYLLSVPTVTNRKASTEPGGTVEAWDG